jgi:hypothetical protein
MLTSIELHQFEFEQLQQSKHLVIVRPVEPQPSGNSLDSSLDGEWLGKPFKINKQLLLLPTIAALPIECPLGKVGDTIVAVQTNTQENIHLSLIQIEVSRLWLMNNETAKATGVEPWYDADIRPDGTGRDEPSIAYLAGLIDHIGATYTNHQLDNPWLWILTVNASSISTQNQPKI